MSPVPLFPNSVFASVAIYVTSSLFLFLSHFLIISCVYNLPLLSVTIYAHFLTLLNPTTLSSILLSPPKLYLYFTVSPLLFRDQFSGDFLAGRLSIRHWFTSV